LYRLVQGFFLIDDDPGSYLDFQLHVMKGGI
jgi:hypothetical protein